MTLCSLGIHNWTKWKFLYDGRLTNGNGAVRDVSVQERECLKCGIKQRHIIDPIMP